METKKCTKCSIDKSVDEFSKKKDGKLGCRSQCKECYKQYRINNVEHYKRYYENNKQHYRQYRKDNIEYYHKYLKDWQKQ